MLADRLVDKMQDVDAEAFNWPSASCPTAVECNNSMAEHGRYTRNKITHFSAVVAYIVFALPVFEQRLQPDLLHSMENF